MRAIRLKTFVTEDHQVSATLPDDVPPGEVELLVLLEDIPVVDDPEDLALYREGMTEYEATGRKSVPLDQFRRERGL